MSDLLPTEAASVHDRADTARNLLRYVIADEWREYRSIVAVFANTFFVELSPEDVRARLEAARADVTLETVPERLESLRRWGNLTVSSSIGNPSSIKDYYRRRHRYLITSPGQEVHDLVEGVLARSDQIADVSTGRLGDIRNAVAALTQLLSQLLADPARAESATPEILADAVRAVFDPHVAFTNEITQFFAALNQWQSRYDLSLDELRLFAEVLVGYVGDRIDEIERGARPIARELSAIRPYEDILVSRLTGGLAARVEQAGLTDTLVVRQLPGHTVQDWANLAAWFVRTPSGPSRLDSLRRDAIAAIRTLTQNLTRLSRTGIGASSRRADFLRLARMIAEAPTDDDVHRLVAASLGMFPARHLGGVAADHDDPQPPSTSWTDAPRASVPVSMRERGDTTNRGQPSQLPDRSQVRELMRLRRAEEAKRIRAAEDELLALSMFDSDTVHTISMNALRHLQSLVSRHRFAPANGQTLSCTIHRTPGFSTVIATPEGRLQLNDIAVEVFRSDSPVPVRGRLG